jgi:hypothetical protein
MINYAFSSGRCIHLVYPIQPVVWVMDLVWARTGSAECFQGICIACWR